MLAAPGEVTGLQTEGTELEVSSTDTNGMNALRTELGVRGLTAELEFALLAVVGALGTRGRTFVPGGTGDTYRSKGRPGRAPTSSISNETQRNEGQHFCPFGNRTNDRQQRTHVESLEAGG